jgi:signal transduction histidine kinase
LQPGTDAPTRSYEDELRSAQKGSLRIACLVAAALLLAFALLDRWYSPSAWMHVLGVRVVAAVLLCACAAVSTRFPPMVVAALGVGIAAGTVEIAMLRLHTEDPYLFSIMLVQAGLTILLPLSPMQALALNLEAVFISLVPLIPRMHWGMMPATTFLFSMALVCVGGAAVQDQLRRREQKARTEFARHYGLVNLGTLAGGLAHELANPLNAMALQVELLDKDSGPPQARLSMLRRQIERMKNILEAMRNGARITGGEQRLVDLTHEADLAYALLETKLRAQASFVRAYADVPQVYAQPTLLGQVLVNLLSNAAEAVAGREEARIALRVRRRGNQACIEVEDNGPGVPDELQEKIFEPFFSTKGEGGNGLGLWISSEIARLHGGDLTVERGGAGGALFRFSLPIPKEV